MKNLSELRQNFGDFPRQPQKLFSFSQLGYVTRRSYASSVSEGKWESWTYAGPPLNAITSSGLEPDFSPPQPESQMQLAPVGVTRT
jgi:hypothetical protein